MARMPTPEVGAEFTISTEPPGHNCKVSVLNPDEVEPVWKFVLPHLERAARYSDGQMEAGDFLPFLINGDMQLWVAVEDHECLAAMVTQIITYPRKRILRVIGMGGREMKRWYPYLGMLERFALENGCTELEGWTKRGLLRLLKDWKVSHMVIKKEIRRLH